MKAKIEKQVVYFPYLAPPPDAMNRTTVLIGSDIVWPQRGEDNIEVFPIVKSAIGKIMSIKIPSGTLEGPIGATWDTGERVAVELFTATWRGRAGGYISGLRGLPWWELAYGTVVSSQILPAGETMPLAMYYKLRELAELKEEFTGALMSADERLRFYKDAYASLKNLLK